MIRLSGSAGSRPCSTRRCFCTPLISICSVPAPASIAERDRLGERAAGADAELLDRAQRGPCGATDVVGPALQPVELLDHRQRDDDVDVAEAGEARRVADQHGRVEHHPGADSAVRRRTRS